MYKKLIYLISIIWILPFFSGCNDIKGKSVDYQTNQFQYRITLIAPNVSDYYWKKIYEGVLKESIIYGFDVQFVGPNETNNVKQIEFIETAIAAQVDGIITQASNPEQFYPVINKAKIAGIPVVLVDSDAPESNRDYYVGSDNFEAGKIAGKAMIEVSGGKANIVIITGIENQGSFKERLEGFRDSINEQKEMRIIAVKEVKDDHLRAMQLTNDVLKTFPEVNAFLGISSNNLQGITKAISEKNNRNSYLIVGFSNGEYGIGSLGNGTINAIIIQNPYLMGMHSVELLNKIFLGKEPEIKIIETDISVMMDNSNINE